MMMKSSRRSESVLQRFPVACSGARSVCSAASPDTAGEFGERYGTGSGSDLVDAEVVAYKAPGRYRSLYRTNSPAVSGLAALHTLLRFRSRPSLFLTRLFAITRPATSCNPIRPIDNALRVARRSGATPAEKRRQ